MPKNPYIGQMDRKITLSVKNTIQSASGAETVQEETVCNPYAFMQDVSGNDVMEGKILSFTSRTYTVRYRREIMNFDSDLLLTDQGKQYEVFDVSEIGRKKHIEIKVRIYE